jgi:hypothetical protein
LPACCSVGGAPLGAEAFGDGEVAEGAVDVIGAGVATVVVSDPGAAGRDDGKRIGVTMNTIAISTSARMVRLSMLADLIC